jgi:hypothetical protein
VIKRFLACVLIAAGLAPIPASATTYGVDYTDLWWVPTENGWGLNVIQQYDTLFATLFVYGDTTNAADRSARWFVASDLRSTSAAPDIFSGTLYQTTGPAFNTTWSGSAAVNQVGTMTLNFNANGVQATLTYSVNGTTVTKTVVRQTFRVNNIAGNYFGGLHAVGTGCGGTAPSGTIQLEGDLVVQHPANGNPSIRLSMLTSTQTCTFSAPYVTNGRLGSMTGSFTCSTGESGTFAMAEMDVSRNGFMSRFTGTVGTCQLNGYFGGIRSVI